jgi:RimJ/RimL family protein N-acetyltransferase
MSEGLRIRLRDWLEADLPELMAWRNDVVLQAQLLAVVRGSSLEQVRAWAQERSAGPPGLLRVIAAREDDAALGYLQLRGGEGRPHAAQLGICLKPSSQGVGIGREALQLLLDHVRTSTALRSIELRVRVDNARALRCYEALGFRRCGFAPRDVHVDGEWCDVVSMERAVRV